MAIISFNKTEKEAIVQKIRVYFEKELDQQIGQFEAGFLLNFFTEEIGPHFYNKGLQDAEAVLHKRLDELTEAIDSLAKPTQARR